MCLRASLDEAEREFPWYYGHMPLIKPSGIDRKKVEINLVSLGRVKELRMSAKTSWS